MNVSAVVHWRRPRGGRIRTVTWIVWMIQSETNGNVEAILKYSQYGDLVETTAGLKVFIKHRVILSFELINSTLISIMVIDNTFKRKSGLFGSTSILGDDASVMNMYVGCYNDENIRESHLRDIDEFINQADDWKDVTVPRCLEACWRLGFKIGALSVSTAHFQKNMDFTFSNDIHGVKLEQKSN